MGHRIDAADYCLAAALLLVPLVYSTRFQHFATPKVGLLSILVGCAAVFFARAADNRSQPSQAQRLALLGIVYVAGLTASSTNVDDLGAGTWYLAGALWLWLGLHRFPVWPPQMLIACIALPWIIDLGLSLLQITGWPLLPATRAAFGTTHGRLVGTVGNPSENAWYLLLAATLLLSLLPSAPSPQPPGVVLLRKLMPLLLLSTLAVLLLNQSRAAIAVAAGLSILALWQRQGPSVRIRLTLIALTLLAAGTALLHWGAVDALSGRLYLARISADMLAEQGVLPAGPGAYARDFPDAQAAYLDAHPTAIGQYSSITHAHCDALEIAYELGAPVLLLVSLAAARGLAERSGRSCQFLLPLGTGIALGLVGYLLYSPAPALLLLVAVSLLRACSDPDKHGPYPAIRTSHRLGPSLLVGVLGIFVLVVGAVELAARQQMAAALRLVPDDLPAAMQLSADAARAWPSAEILLQRANLELIGGDPLAAVGQLERSYRQRPRAETARTLFRVSCDLGRSADAAHWRRAALRLDPRTDPSGRQGTLWRQCHFAASVTAPIRVRPETPRH